MSEQREDGHTAPEHSQFILAFNHRDSERVWIQVITEQAEVRGHLDLGHLHLDCRLLGIEPGTFCPPSTITTSSLESL